jgi:RNA polymerase sigma-70 factor (ECF subfamily)
MFRPIRGAVRLESDRQLVHRVLTGDRQSFAALVERYQHAVFAVALKVLDNRQAAEDTAQDAFVAAYENLGQLSDANTFGPWLLVIARNQALRLARKRPRTVPLDGHDTPEQSFTDVPESDDMANVMTALDRLPPHEQHVLVLRYFQGHPVSAVAQITGRSVGTVTKQISRALARLREKLQRSHP